MCTNGETRIPVGVLCAGVAVHRCGQGKGVGLCGSRFGLWTATEGRWVGRILKQPDADIPRRYENASERPEVASAFSSHATTPEEVG